jgi:hypothetical protein
VVTILVFQPLVHCFPKTSDDLLSCCEKRLKCVSN